MKFTIFQAVIGSVAIALLCAETTCAQVSNSLPPDIDIPEFVFDVPIPEPASNAAAPTIATPSPGHEAPLPPPTASAPTTKSPTASDPTLTELPGSIYKIGRPDGVTSSSPEDETPLDDTDEPAETFKMTGSFDSGGIMFNTRNPRSHFNGPATFADRDNGQLDEIYSAGGFAFGTDGDGWSGGLRYDLLFGSDYYFATAAGLDGRPRGNKPRWNTDDGYRYGWSMPQLFGQINYDNLDFKVGHFYTPIGYESAEQSHNFFTTRSYAFQYGEPKTHTGVMFSDMITDNWTEVTGIVGGWDTFDADDRPALLEGITYHVSNQGSLALTLITGDDSTTNQPGIGPFANRTMYSLIGIANLSDRFSYVFQHDLGLQQNAATLQGRALAEWYGINQYLFYQLSDCCMIGARFEWFRDDDGFNVTGLRPGNPLVGNFFAGNFYETSIGLNYRCGTAWTLRPEVRYDSFSPTNRNIGSQNPFDDNTSKYQILFGIDAVAAY